jgi:nitric oxide reductase NorD protein
LRKLPPWADCRQVKAFSDGVQIFLPRSLHVFQEPRTDTDLLRLMALMLAVRLERDSVAGCPSQPIARDLFWAVDSVVVEGFLSLEFPGLVPSITAARHWAQLSRPVLEALRPGERAVERVVQKLLIAPLGHETPLGHGSGLVPHPLPESLTARELAVWASGVAAEPPFHTGAMYRGVAPVVHWGWPRPELLRRLTADKRRSEAIQQPRRPIPSQHLPHHIEAQTSPEEQPHQRDGPFLLPHEDPQQSVEAASSLRRPLDQGEEQELDALAEELGRLGRVSRVESDAEVREILEVEGFRPQQSPSHGAGQVNEAGRIAYPEWDYRVGVYRQHYCLLRETAALRGNPHWSTQVLCRHRGLICTIRRRFEALRPRRWLDTQQLDGPELDLDAYVDDFGARRAGRLPTDRLYLNDRPRRREVAVALLMDISGSTGAWVSGAQHVLAVEQEAALVFCEALHALGDHCAVYAFASQGRRDVRVYRVKGFAEAYGELVGQRLAGLQTQSFTRLGAPIRHLTAHLSHQRARLRLLFLLSDGKPNDEDEYEGPYGLEDTRQAVAEANLQGIRLFCLAIDRHGSTDLARMFGPRGYTILWDIAQLPQRLAGLYWRLTHVHS